MEQSYNDEESRKQEWILKNYINNINIDNNSDIQRHFDEDEIAQITLSNQNNIDSYTFSDEFDIPAYRQIYDDGFITIRTIYATDDGYIWDLYERKEEWATIDSLISIYQKGITPDADIRDKQASQNASIVLLRKFYPLFRKYLILLSTGQINYRNTEQKQFIKLFIDQPHLKAALNTKNTPIKMRPYIAQKFAFITLSYGQQSTDEILEDLHTLFFILAKRYKPVGKSFCCYCYNSFKFEVARFIKKYLKTPNNIPYKIIDYPTEYIYNDNDGMEDAICTDAAGNLDASWIQGLTCSDVFSILSPAERRILCRYYIDNWNDSQIAADLGVHMNTLNKKRNMIIKKLAKSLGIDMSKIKRTRKSGRKAHGAPDESKRRDKANSNENGVVRL